MAVLSCLQQDVIYGLRSLRKERGLLLMAVLMLALGIGSTAAIFSIVYNAVLRPFPYRNADRLAVIYIHDVREQGNQGRHALSAAELKAFREENQVFEDLIGSRTQDVFFRDTKGTRLFAGVFVTANAFQLLAGKSLLGRPIAPPDGEPNAPPVLAMSYQLWKSQFGGDPHVLGTTLVLNGEPRTLVGIMPANFRYGAGDVWIPLTLETDGRGIQGQLWSIGLLKPGISLAQAAAEFEVIVKKRSTSYPREYPENFTVFARSLTDSVLGDFRTLLYGLVGAVCLLFGVACSNVANLLITRATTRQQEMAVRMAMGASRARLVRQLLVESLVLAMVSAVPGIILAYVGLKGFVAVLPEGVIPAEATITLNWVTLLFALLATLVTTLLFGLAPAVKAARTCSLGGAANRVSTTFQYGKMRSALVVIQVAFSIVLLIVAGLMMRSFLSLTHMDLGFDPRNLVHARLALPQGRYTTAIQKKQFFEQVMQRVTTLPGVTAATVAISLPPDRGPISEVDVPGRRENDRVFAMLQLCSEGYLRTLGRGLLRGRWLSESDIESSHEVAVVNETLVHNFFPGENPIGRKIRFLLLEQFPETRPNSYFEIIGVLKDSKNRGLYDPPTQEAYIPYTVPAFPGGGLLIRTADRPGPLLENVRKQVWAIDPEVPLDMTWSIESFLQEHWLTVPEFGLAIFASFAGIGLVLVAIGVFSVLKYWVLVQMHDIGIRMAIGAPPSRVLAGVLRQGIILVLAGVALGEIVAFGVTRFISSQIWGVSPTDRLTFGIVVVLMLVVGAAACWSPARRATRVDPAVVLRYE